MTVASTRRGFTLVEILIVLGIIAAVAAIFVPVALNLTARNQVPKAASMLENAMHRAKARAIAEKRPNGIRLVLQDLARRQTGGSLGGFAWYDEIQYIEDPGDFSEHFVWGIADGGTVTMEHPWWSFRRGGSTFGPAAPSPGALPWGIDTITVVPTSYTYAAFNTSGTTTLTVPRARNRLIFGPISFADWNPNPPKTFIHPTTGAIANIVAGDTYRSQRFQFSYSFKPTPSSPYTVQVGDSIEILGTGELYRIVSVSTGGVTVSPSHNAQVSVLEVDRDLTTNIQPSLNGRPNYRIIRQPRVVASLQPIKLPQDVVIDLTKSRQTILGIPNADLDTNNQYFMSGVSTGVNLNDISGLTTVTPNLVPPEYIDIMFSASGEIIPTEQVFRPAANQNGGFSVGASGLIALWIHQWGDPNLWANRQATAAQGNADNQAIVAVNARTGFIGSYPMTPLAISTDPLNYARIGKARTSADTGQ